MTFALLLCSGMVIGCQPNEAQQLYSQQGYTIMPSDSTAPSDTQWANYLHDHLKNRTKDKNLIQKQSTTDQLYQVIVEMGDDLGADYKIVRKKSSIRLIAKNKSTMLWLQYQFMKQLSEDDKRFEANDLPPAIIAMRDTLANFTFKYSAIYTPTNLLPDHSGIAGTHNIDNDWGIWGHNLNKVLGKNLPEEGYALVNGARSIEQYCFSSNEVYQRIEHYIIDQFGEKEHNYFLIAPNDNMLACECPDCKAVGNSTGKATPAVTQLVVRLGKRFPTHHFFTTSYLTTHDAPKKALPTNVGVVISAMTLPYSAELNRNESLKTTFLLNINNWKSVTQNIYVWDYINNFDDYFTPFPILKTMQQRLLLYKENGISGVILNGSGYQYSSFDEMRTFALSALLMNPDFSSEMLLENFMHNNHPESKALIEEFYRSLEKANDRNSKILNMYGGINNAVNSYLEINPFITFYDSLNLAVERLSGEERKQVHQLAIALSLTRLEIARYAGFSAGGCYQEKDGKGIVTPEVENIIKRLSESTDFKEMTTYNEQGARVDSYLAAWKKYIIDQAGCTNLLREVTLKTNNASIKEEMKLATLTDGVRGLPISYHFGWETTTQPIIELTLPSETVCKGKELEIGFLQQSIHNIIAPERVEILCDGKLDKSIEVIKIDTNDQGELWKARCNIKYTTNQIVTLRIIAATGINIQTAIDEVLLIP